MALSFRLGCSAHHFLAGTQAQIIAAIPTTKKTTKRIQCLASTAAPKARTCGPNFNTSKAKSTNRSRRPRKIANRKCQKFISKAEAARTTALNGNGGGSMEGTIKAQTSCRSNDARIFSNFERGTRFSSRTSPPRYPIQYKMAPPAADPAAAIKG